jgi:hypothetical protein
MYPLDLEHYFHKQCEYGLNRLLDYVVEEYGAIWTEEVSELLADDAYDNFTYPVFNETEEFVYYSDAMDYLLLGCNDIRSGAERILDVVEFLNAYDEESFGEILWTKQSINSCTMANMLHYWIGYHYAVPKLQELNGAFTDSYNGVG